MTEQQTQKKIIDYLESLGAYVFKTIKVNRAGVADIICCIGGMFVAFEVKAAKGKPSPLQLHHEQLVIGAGGYSAVVYSVEDVIRHLVNWGFTF